MTTLLMLLALSLPPVEHFRFAVEFPHGEGGSGWMEVTIPANDHEVVVTSGERHWTFERETLEAMRERWGYRSFSPRWPSERCSEAELVWRFEYGERQRTWCRNKQAVHAIAELSALLQVLTN